MCVWDFDMTRQSLDSPIAEKLRTQLGEVLSSSGSYAVRSSASHEDGREHSFAGQFLTKLDVRGT